MEGKEGPFDPETRTPERHAKTRQKQREMSGVKAWWWCVNEETQREKGMCRTGDQSINKLIN